MSRGDPLSVAIPRRNVVFQDGLLGYQSEGRCRFCASKGDTSPQPTVSMGCGTATAAPMCRTHYEAALKFFDDVAIRLKLGPTGMPALAPPPVLETWLVNRGGTARLGVARLARISQPGELEVHDLFLFPQHLRDPRADILVQEWQSEWLPRDENGVHHVTRSLPHKVLLEHRYKIRLPDDAPDGVIRIRIDQPA